MLVQDIKPQIQRVARNAKEKIIRHYRLPRFFAKTSRYGVPVVVIIILLFGATIAVAFPDNEKTATFYFTTVTAEEVGKGAASAPALNRDTATSQEELTAEKPVPHEPEVILPNIDGELAPEGLSQESPEDHVEEGLAGGGGSSPSSTAGEWAPTKEVPDEKDIDTGDEKLKEEVASETTIPPEGEALYSPAIFTNSQELLILKFVSEGGPPEDEYLVKRVRVNFPLALGGREGEDDTFFVNYRIKGAKSWPLFSHYN